MPDFPLGDLERMLIDRLLNTAQPVAVNYLSNRLGVSRRTVYYSISNINIFLNLHGLGSVDSRRGEGLMLSLEQKAYLSKLLEQEPKSQMAYLLSAKERTAVMICFLAAFPGKLNVEHLTSACDVSRSTILSDMKEVRKILGGLSFQVDYHRQDGYRLIGTKLQKRALFAYYLSECLQVFNANRFSFLDFDAIDEYQKRYEAIESKLDMEYVKDALLTQASLMAVARANNWGIEPLLRERIAIAQSAEYLMLADHFSEIPEDEKIFFAAQLNCTRIVKGKRLPIKTGKHRESTLAMAAKLVMDFERLSCINFRDRETLISLLAAHMDTSLARYHLGVLDRNPFVEDVKTNYSEVFYLAKKNSETIADSYPMTDEEVSYFTMYFCAHFDQVHRISQSRARVIVVCPNSMASSVLLKKKLQEFNTLIQVLDAVPRKQLDVYPHSYDFIVSTINIPECENVIVVNPVMTEEDKQKVLSHIFQFRWSENAQSSAEQIFRKIEPYLTADTKEEAYSVVCDYVRTQLPKVGAPISDEKPCLKDMLRKENVVFHHERIPYEYAVWLAAGPLLQQRAISPAYVEAIIRNEKEHGSYNLLTEDLALAHAAPEDGVFTLGLSLLINSSGFVFHDGKKAKLMLLLAPVDQQKHLVIINDTADYFSLERFQQELLGASAAQQVVQIIHDYARQDGKER